MGCAVQWLPQKLHFNGAIQAKGATLFSKPPYSKVTNSCKATLRCLASSIQHHSQENMPRTQWSELWSWLTPAHDCTSLGLGVSTFGNNALGKQLKPQEVISHVPPNKVSGLIERGPHWESGYGVAHQHTPQSIIILIFESFLNV